MSVRKRAWKTSNGSRKEAWVVDYVDQRGKRHLKTFQRKKEAEDLQGDCCDRSSARNTYCGQ